MQSIPNFEDMKEELFKEDLYNKMKTLCFDIENVFLRKVDLLDIEELNTLSNAEEFETSYMLISHKA
jgi:hypothetical protein